MIKMARLWGRARVEAPPPRVAWVGRGEPDDDAPVTPMSVAGPPLSRVEEDRVVAAYLARATVDGGLEIIGDFSVSAFKSLAESRGLSLEQVVRAACRNELAAVISRPVTNQTEEGVKRA